MAVGYFAARWAKLKHQRYSLLKVLADAFDFLSLLSKKVGAPLQISPESLEELFTFVCDWFLGE